VPPYVELGDGERAVPVDVISVDARLSLDAASRSGRAVADVLIDMELPGHPVLDLRQDPVEVAVDGEALRGEPFPRRDMGAGAGAEMRVLRRPLDAGRHRLRIAYPLDRPAAVGAEPVGWEDGGVRFDLWMSDLHPGRYLEMWVPANLCHDRFTLTVDLDVEGAARDHAVVANGEVSRAAAGRWRVSYPGHFTSLSPMLVVTPADAVEVVVRPRGGDGPPGEVMALRHLEVDADLESCADDIASWLDYNTARYGPWVHGPRFTAFVWGPGRGMEYDGATTASVGALEHEVLHSWFGRGLKPATAADGWIDEAYATWATSSRRSEAPRFDVAPLGLDSEPVLLRPGHPWARHTPRESYALGGRLFAGMAHELGGAGRLRSAMASWYRRATVAGDALVTTDGLQAHLSAAAGRDLGAWFDRYVHGRG
jgi:hypothetical protein